MLSSVLSVQECLCCKLGYSAFRDPFTTPLRPHDSPTQNLGVATPNPPGLTPMYLKIL